MEWCKMKRHDLKRDCLKLEAVGGRHFNMPALCKPVPAAAKGAADASSDADDADDLEAAPQPADGGKRDDDDDLPLDLYSVFDNQRSTVFAPEFDDMMQRNWDREFRNTYEEDRRVSPIDMDQRVKEVEIPCIIARGSPPRDYTCWCCGERAAHDVQMPTEVYATGYCVGGPAEAIRSLVKFGELLEKREFDEAIKRAAVCRRVHCMISQHKLTSEDYETWYFSGVNGAEPRKQLERGTDRKDQGAIFAENVLLLRWFAQQEEPKPLSNGQIAALFHWVLVNSQFVQEREKRFIATAMAIVDCDTFPYKFPEKQSFVNTMAAIPRNYIENVILPHIFDLSITDKDRWTSWGNRLLETAFPKAPDAAYMLMCLDNWEQQNKPRDDDGRPSHRILRAAVNARPELAKVFTVEGFRNAVSRAVGEAHPKGTDMEHGYMLFYASAPPTTSSVKMGKKQSRRDTQALLRLLTGSNKRCYALAKGVQGKNAAPTCGSKQADSGVHTKQRYDGVASAILLKGEEKADSVRLFVDVWEQGNSVGKEKLQGKSADRTKAKACAALRPVQVFDERCLSAATAHKRQKKSEAMASVDSMHKLGRRSPGGGHVSLLGARSTSSSSLSLAPSPSPRLSEVAARGAK